MPRPHSRHAQDQRNHPAEVRRGPQHASGERLAADPAHDGDRPREPGTRAGLSWPLPEDLEDDEALEARLFAPAEPLKARPSPDWQKVHNELHRPGVTLMLLWFEYRECFPDGYAYSQFCEHYRRWRRHLDVVMRQSHKAGEKLFVDFPGDKIPIYDPTTWEIAFEAELFVGVLGASSYLYAEAVRSQRLEHWVAAHVKALEFYGGCPAILVSDNLASGVTRAHRYEPDVNATYQDMAAHYGVAVIPARPYKARDKAKVEAGVLLAERWIMARLRNHRFSAIAEANVEIARLVSLGERPTLQEDRRLATKPLRGDRPPGAWSSPGQALRVRPLQAGQGQHRLPRRDPGPPLLLGPLHLRGRGARTAHDPEHDRSLQERSPGRLARAQLREAALCHRPGAHAREPSPPCRVDALAHHLLGGEDRPTDGQARRGDHGEAPPSRTGLPVLPRHRAPRWALWRRPPGGGLHEGAQLCGPTATARSSPS